MNQLSDEQFDQVLNLLKAMADRSRLKIIGLISDRERTVKDLAELMELKEPTVSSHLSMLKELGLVEMRVEKNSHYYRYRAEDIHSILKMLKPKPFDTDAEYEASDDFERNVLNHFLVDGKLTEIPAHQKKLSVILKFLAKRFDRGVQYTEKRVNEILKQYHPDCATIRRMFIGHKFMARRNGLYWVLEAETQSKGEMSEKTLGDSSYEV